MKSSGRAHLVDDDRGLGWLTLNAFVLVAAISDKLQSWFSYLFGASIVIALMISGIILALP